jgi:outer membrane receptor protein involved in Fe transport
MYNVSYKLPTLQNIALNNENEIKPETIKEGQLQLGLHNKKLEFSVTAFINQISGLLIYDYADQIESYRNKGEIKTTGIETELKWSIQKFTLISNYSFYRPFNSNAYDVLIDSTEQKNGNLAFPSHKFFIRLSYPILKNLSLNLTETFQSKKTFVTRINSLDDYEAVEVSPTHMLNLSCQLSNLFHKNIGLNIGVFNLLNTVNYYGYSYQSGYFPMIGMGRELFIQLNFRL